jgi:hypothetical protein
MIPEHIIEAVREIPIVDIVSHYTAIKRQGGGYIGLCPFHDERTPSFHVHPAKGLYKCFGCGAGGDGIRFVMEYDHRTYPEAVQIICGIARIAYETTKRDDCTPPVRKAPPKPDHYDTIPLSLLPATVADVAANSLTAQIADIVGPDIVREVLKEYRIVIEPEGFIQYPQIDKAGRYRSGKSIQYINGHRTDQFRWAHKRHKDHLPADFKLKQCLRGEHLIGKMPIAVVEGESTMLFMAALAKVGERYGIKQLGAFSGFTWVSTGGANGISWNDPQILEAFKGREVCLYPDSGFYEAWEEAAKGMRKNSVDVQVSGLIEGKLAHNDDLRDWFMRYADDIRQLCRSVDLNNQYFSKDIDTILCETITGKQFNNFIMAFIRTVAGNSYDLLFDADKNLIRPGDQDQIVQQLATFYGKQLQKANFDNSPCWASLLQTDAQERQSD